MTPSDMTALHVLASIAWGGNLADRDAEVLSDGRLSFDSRAIPDDARAVLAVPSYVRPGVGPKALRAWTCVVESRKGAVLEFGIDEESESVTWATGSANSGRFALAQLACPAEEFAEFDLHDDQGRYGLLGIRTGVIVWALMGLERSLR